MMRPNYARRRLAVLVTAGTVALATMAGAPAAVWSAYDDHSLFPDPIPEAGASESTVNLAGIPTPDQLPVPGDCASWFGTAMRAGWTWDTWPMVGSVLMPRESGCGPAETNIGCTYYPRLGRTICEASIGLLMLNTLGKLWDKPIAWGYPSLKDLCGLTDRTQLLDGYTNLRCGRLLFEVHAAVYGNGWKPW